VWSDRQRGRTTSFAEALSHLAALASSRTVPNEAMIEHHADHAAPGLRPGDSGRAELELDETHRPARGHGPSWRST
jgi:hypothetical protein